MTYYGNLSLSDLLCGDPLVAASLNGSNGEATNSDDVIYAFEVTLAVLLSLALACVAYVISLLPERHRAYRVRLTRHGDDVDFDFYQVRDRQDSNHHVVRSALNGANGEATGSDDLPNSEHLERITNYRATLDDLYSTLHSVWEGGLVRIGRGVRITRSAPPPTIEESVTPSVPSTASPTPAESEGSSSVSETESKADRIRAVTLRNAFRAVGKSARRVPLPPTSDVGDRGRSQSGLDAGLAQLPDPGPAEESPRPNRRARQRENRRSRGASAASPPEVQQPPPTTTPVRSDADDSLSSSTELDDLPTIDVPLYETKVRVMDLIRGHGRLTSPMFNRSEEAPYALGYRYSSTVKVVGSHYQQLLDECQGMRVASDYSIDNIRRCAVKENVDSVVLPRVVQQHLQFQRLEDNRYGCSSSVVPLGSLNCLAPASGILVGSVSTTAIALTLGSLFPMVYFGGSIGGAMKLCTLGIFRGYNLIRILTTPGGRIGPSLVRRSGTVAMCTGLIAIIWHWQQIVSFMTKSEWALSMRRKLAFLIAHLRSVLGRIFRTESDLSY